MFQNKIFYSRFVLTFLVVVCLRANAAVAQAISLSNPTTAMFVNEGDDFARRELNNPWDFMQRRDIGWEENYDGNSIRVAGGVWRGVAASAGAYLFPLFAGFKGLLFAEGLPGDNTLPRLGINHPIDASKYTLLSYRLNQTNRSSYAIYWTTDINDSFWPTGENFRANFDGFYHAGKPYFYNSWHLYSHNLSVHTSFQQAQGNWNSKVYALRIDPSLSAQAGAVTEIDWIRLVDPNSAPTIAISWNCLDYPAKSLVQVYMDKDNHDYNGTAIAEYPASASGNYLLKTAILPPGKYYFYVELKRNGDLAPIARSNYSARLTVNEAPTGYFTTPTQISGDEYSAKVTKNKWDMSDASDISNLSPATPHALRQFSQSAFVGGRFQALADAANKNASGSDAQVHLSVKSSSPIDTSEYRYVTYRMAIDGTHYPSIADKVRSGFVARSVFWNDNIMTDGVRPPAHVVYEGWHTYSYDMRGTNAGFGLLEAGVPFRWSRFLRNFRIDPLETQYPTWFYVDDVKLNAENRTKERLYKISWVIRDPDSATVKTKLYYDTDDRGFNGKLITTLYNLKPGSHSYIWDTQNIKARRYYIYAVLEDAKNSAKFYAPVYIAVGD